MIRTLFVVLLLAASAHAATNGSPPELLARTKDGVVAFTLERTTVDAQVVGVMSLVRVKQTYRNPFKVPIEAVYVFPLPSHAAIHAMQMRVGGRVVTAKIEKRSEARHDYEQARDEGKTASLMEEERENVFTQSVANILPGDAIEVEVAYTEELAPTDGEYEFLFPMVVTPRYAAGAKDAAKVTPPTLNALTRPGNDITMHVWIEGGVPIEGLRSPTHDVSVKSPSPSVAVVDLKPTDRIPNKDFSLRYRLAGEQPRATVLASDDSHGGHVLLMVQPKVDLRSADAAPREYVFVVDVSGSMEGEPHARCKKAMAMLLADLRATDRVQVILFESGVQAAWPTSQPATRSNVQQALAFVDSSTARGGTEVLPALRAAVEAKRDPGLAREIVLMTDGGIANEDEVLTYLRAHRRGLNVFAFGVGASVNRSFIDALARIGHGEPFVLLPNDDAGAATKKLFRLMSRPSLTDVEVDWGGLAVHDMTPAHPPDLFADRPIVVSAKVDHLERATSASITIRGRLAGKPYEEQVPLVMPAAIDKSPSLAFLWARRRITELGDEHPVDDKAAKKLEAAITELGLAYHLLTLYTSFVAIDETPRAAPGRPLKVQQPVSLPDGVSDKAASVIGGHLSSYSVRGGDPELQITAPHARRVSVTLPGGETKSLRYDVARAYWVTSFLVPAEMDEGEKVLTVILELDGGQVMVRRMRMRVDNQSPELALSLSRSTVAPGEQVELVAASTALRHSLEPLDEDIGDLAAHVMADIEDVVAIGPDGAIVKLVAAADHRFTATFAAPTTPGTYRVQVLARDGARNGTRAVVEFAVR